MPVKSTSPVLSTTIVYEMRSPASSTVSTSATLVTVKSGSGTSRKEISKTASLKSESDLIPFKSVPRASSSNATTVVPLSSPIIAWVVPPTLSGLTSSPAVASAVWKTGSPTLVHGSFEPMERNCSSGGSVSLMLAGSPVVGLTNWNSRPEMSPPKIVSLNPS